MTIKQISLLGNQGIYNVNDHSQTATALADYPYFLNGYFEDTGNVDVGNEGSQIRKYAYLKRPGLSSVLTSSFTAGHKIYGMATHTRRDIAVIYTSNASTANETWYLNGSTLTSKGAAPAAAGTWSLNSAVSFTVLDSANYNGNFWAATDLVKGALIDGSGTWTEITDADFTGISKLTNLEALDGYLFLGDSQNRIYNSDLNIPSLWGATSFISANDFPGTLMWLKRLRNYLVVFKTGSIEFFEDVGNPTPGSPLESRKQLNRAIGLVTRVSVQEVSDGLIFCGTAKTGGNKLYKIDKATLQIKEISTRYVEQCLVSVYNYDLGQSTLVADQTILNVNNGPSQSFQMLGKEFYCISLPDPQPLSSNHTMQVFDNDLNVWTTWASSILTSGVNDTAGFTGSYGQSYITITSGTARPITIFADNSGTTARIVYVDSTNPSFYDTGSGNNSYIFSWTSDVIDFGSRSRKFLDSLEVLYDIDSSQAPDHSGSTIGLSYRDYDFSATAGFVGTRTLALDSGGGVRAMAQQLGSFRRRVFTLVYMANSNLRIWGIELNYNSGETNEEG